MSDIILSYNADAYSIKSYHILYSNHAKIRFFIVITGHYERFLD